MEIQEKIKEIYSSLKSDRKESTKIFISKHFGKKVDGIKNNWLLKGNVPIQHQNEVYEILMKELETQINEDKLLLI